MTSFTRSRSFRRGLTVIYWIALPLVLLAAIGAVLPGNEYQGWLPSWVYAAGFVAFAALICWRLWLNSRTLGYATPSAGRFLRVILPLGLLAIAGLVIALVGAVCIGLGVWLTVDPQLDQPPGFWAIGTAVIGVFAVAFGLLLTIPFFRAMRRKPSKEPEAAEPEP